VLGVWQASIALGLFCVAIAAVLALMNFGRMSDSMPTQVPPLRIARRVLIVGIVLLLVGCTGVATNP
jgi:glycerol uptake facilitator-like aquaporin